MTYLEVLRKENEELARKNRWYRETLLDNCWERSEPGDDMNVKPCPQCAKTGLGFGVFDCTRCAGLGFVKKEDTA
jgi:hypothetical protein